LHLQRANGGSNSASQIVALWQANRRLVAVRGLMGRGGEWEGTGGDGILTGFIKFSTENRFKFNRQIGVADSKYVVSDDPLPTAYSLDAWTDFHA